MDLWRYVQTRLHPHCAGGLLDTEHAASTHLHKIETGQQADTVFGQDPLLSRRHGQASRYLNKFQDVTTKEWLSSPAGVLSWSDALHGEMCSGTTGGLIRSRFPVSTTARPSISVYEKPRTSFCACRPMSGPVENGASTIKGRRRRRGSAGAQGRRGDDSIADTDDGWTRMTARILSFTLI